MSPKRRTLRRATLATKAKVPRYRRDTKPIRDAVGVQKDKQAGSARPAKIRQRFYDKSHILKDKKVLEGIRSIAPDVLKRFFVNRRNALRNLGGTKALRVKLSRLLRNICNRRLRALRDHLVGEVFLLRTHGNHQLLYVSKHTSLHIIRTIIRYLPNTVSSITRSRLERVTFRRESWHGDGSR